MQSKHPSHNPPRETEGIRTVTILDVQRQGNLGPSFLRKLGGALAVLCSCGALIARFPSLEFPQKIHPKKKKIKKKYKLGPDGGSQPAEVVWEGGPLLDEKEEKKKGGFFAGRRRRKSGAFSPMVKCDHKKKK